MTAIIAHEWSQQRNKLSYGCACILRELVFWGGKCTWRMLDYNLEHQCGLAKSAVGRCYSRLRAMNVVKPVAYGPTLNIEPAEAIELARTYEAEIPGAN